MATSTVNAPMKKDGYGGSYTWGGVMDVKDFEPHFVQQPKVVVMPAQYVTAPQPQRQVLTCAPPGPSFTVDASQFPALGAARTTIAPAAWGPATVQSAQTQPIAVQTAHYQIAPQSIRLQPGSFDAQHPRNMFARFPRTSTTATATAEPQLAVDWSAAGTSTVTQVIYQHAAGVAPQAQLGPVMKQHAPVPLQVLREELRAGPPAAQRIIVPRLQQHYIQTVKPSIQQPQSRSARKN